MGNSKSKLRAEHISSLAEKTFTTPAPTPIIVDADELKDLRLKEIFCRYGEQFGLTSSNGILNGDSTRAYWMKLGGAIREEESLWANFDNLDRKFHTPFTWAVYLVNNDLSWDFESTIRAIHMYADRRSHGYLGLDALLDANNVRLIANTLYDDIRDVDSICPPGWEGNGTMQLLKQHICTVRDKWFSKYHVVEYPNEPHAWSTTPELEAWLRFVAAERSGRC
ncbi:hypothetical protein Slin15195_G089970 [Septoria linicola]|uniref:Uncharacterized protein n=1 Tax=Septoria linicola TaxID=215465 RepID=A0A9Q9B157_9PEZI|nr:hypothetical protein Slin14017_G125580 [Septoria linicola]USW55678.1 hypothetical protein Slin15195_G089970 [Septoria linicola]